MPPERCKETEHIMMVRNYLTEVSGSYKKPENERIIERTPFSVRKQSGWVAVCQKCGFEIFICRGQASDDRWELVKDHYCPSCNKNVESTEHHHG